MSKLKTAAVAPCTVWSVSNAAKCFVFLVFCQAHTMAQLTKVTSNPARLRSLLNVSAPSVHGPRAERSQWWNGTCHGSKAQSWRERDLDGVQLKRY